MKIDGLENIDLSAAKEITLICGGSSVKISEDGVKFSTSGNLTLKCAALQKRGPTKLDANILSLPNPTSNSAVKFHFTNQEGLANANRSYIAELPNGKVITGVTDSNGYTQAFCTENENEQISIHLIK